jgi:hypothetical protein
VFLLPRRGDGRTVGSQSITTHKVEWLRREDYDDLGGDALKVRSSAVLVETRFDKLLVADGAVGWNVPSKEK